MLLPALAMLAFVFLYPIVWCTYLSFTDRRLVGREANFIGLQNYVTILTSFRFYEDLWHTFYYTLASVVLQVLVGLGVATLLNQPVRAKGLFRTLMIIPYATPSVAIAISWRWICYPAIGFLNIVGRYLGFASYDWFAEVSTAMPMAIFVNVWFGTPLMTLAILAGMQGIPQEQYDAANVDGTGSLQRFWYITLPLVKPIILVMATLRTIWIFNYFDMVFLLTGGGPAGTTETVPLLAYFVGWQAPWNLGLAASVAVLVLLILFATSMIYMKAAVRE
jgi:multiple sugar transport system permease protein